MGDFKVVIVARMTPVTFEAVFACINGLFWCVSHLQWMEQVKLLILGFEIFEKVHSRPEIWAFEYNHSKLVKIC